MLFEIFTIKTRTHTKLNGNTSHYTNRLVTMWLLTGRFEDKLMNNLELAASAKQGFSTAFLLPDTQDVLDAPQVLAQSHNDGANLQLLETDIQKHDKAGTDVLCPPAIYHRTSTEVACLNLSAIVKITTPFIETVLIGHDTPFLQISARRITLMTNLAAFCQYQVTGRHRSLT